MRPQASRLEPEDDYGEVWYRETERRRVSQLPLVRARLVAGWQTVPALARALGITPPLARYYVYRLAATELVFSRRRGELHGRAWARTFRIYPEATHVRRMGRVR